MLIFSLWIPHKQISSDMRRNKGGRNIFFCNLWNYLFRENVNVQVSCYSYYILFRDNEEYTHTRYKFQESKCPTQIDDPNKMR